MSTADEAVEAGVRALAGAYWERATDDARATAGAMWPVLSAPIRELHTYHECTDWRDCRIMFGGMCAKTGHCAHCAHAMPCPTTQAVLVTDRALGIGEGVTE